MALMKQKKRNFPFSKGAELPGELMRQFIRSKPYVYPTPLFHRHGWVPSMGLVDLPTLKTIFEKKINHSCHHDI